MYDDLEATDSMAAAKAKSKSRRKNRTVPPSDVVAWRSEMALSQRDAAERLGMSRTFLDHCEATGAPLYVALAMAAVAAGLEPYSPDDNDKLRRLARIAADVERQY